MELYRCGSHTVFDSITDVMIAEYIASQEEDAEKRGDSFTILEA